jgi:hypothetical protein
MTTIPMGDKPHNLRATFNGSGKGDPKREFNLPLFLSLPIGLRHPVLKRLRLED